MRRFVLVALLFGLSACATTEATVPVAYKTDAPASATGPLNIRVSVAATDGRTTNRGRISTKINGYGMEMAPIHAQEPVEKTVADALTQELTSRGYSVAQGGVTVNAVVETFYNQFKVGAFAGKANGEVALKVSVTDASGAVLFSREAKGANSKSIQMASGKNAAESIGAALHVAIVSLFDDKAFVAALAGTKATA